MSEAERAKCHDYGSQNLLYLKESARTDSR